MISPKCWEVDWIENQWQRHKVGDPGLLEAAIHALTLLCRLRRFDLDFVFKGGTSMLLHLPEIRRLSVDIDIVCQAPRSEFERVLNEVAAQPPFAGWREDARGPNRLPKRRHYFVDYPSRRHRHGIRAVTIDVVEETCPIEDLEPRTVLTSFVEITEETTVTVPTIDALLADKLTAFAPHSVGVPLTERYSQQVVKQMFDVGELFQVAVDLEAVRRNYRRIHHIESSYRESKHGFEESLSDTVETCFHLSQAGLKGDTNTYPQDRELLLKGIRQLRGHLVNHVFNRDEAKISASRAARLAVHILKNHEGSFDTIRYSVERLSSMRSATISGARKPMMRLKAIPEALYHWQEISKMESE